MPEPPSAAPAPQLLPKSAALRHAHVQCEDVNERQQHEVGTREPLQGENTAVFEGSSKPATARDCIRSAFQACDNQQLAHDKCAQGYATGALRVTKHTVEGLQVHKNVTGEEQIKQHMAVQQQAASNTISEGATMALHQKLAASLPGEALMKCGLFMPTGHAGSHADELHMALMCLNEQERLGDGAASVPQAETVSRCQLQNRSAVNDHSRTADIEAIAWVALQLYTDELVVDGWPNNGSCCGHESAREPSKTKIFQAAPQSGTGSFLNKSLRDFGGKSPSVPEAALLGHGGQSFNKQAELS
jgi:hypothetical protein